VRNYTPDAAGNITSDGTRTFTYNYDNRLIQVSAGQTLIAEYACDGFGRRVKKTVGSETVLFHYDYDGNLISETDGSGSPLRDYIYLNGEPVAMKLYGDQAGIYYFINDHLGTPQKVTDTSGTVVWEAGYMPFGEARILIADIENNLRFPGQYYDSGTGLHYNYHRYYDPDTGRYLTPDPIGLEGGINLYAYVDGNPVNWVDFYGLVSHKFVLMKYPLFSANRIFLKFLMHIFWYPVPSLCQI
jgi:RHS repeat-associated protein